MPTYCRWLAIETGDAKLMDIAMRHSLTTRRVLVRDGVYYLHKGLGVGESVMWGEYFFVEALDRALRL